MHKPTLGPWRLDKHGAIQTDSGILLVSGVAMPSGNHPQAKEAEANSRLIASAPELLEALKYARRFLDERDHDTGFVDAAIAKATGEAR